MRLCAQRNPRYCDSVVGRSILTNEANRRIHAHLERTPKQPPHAAATGLSPRPMKRIAAFSHPARIRAYLERKSKQTRRAASHVSAHLL
jgi:hypothetical protein